MGKKLPPAHEWQQRELEHWNATTFAAYLKDKHKERLGVDYIPGRPVQVERRLLKSMYEEYGKKVLRDFIDACLTVYRPNGNFRTCSFYFMYTYMRPTVLPSVLDWWEREGADQQEEDVTNITW